MLILIICFLSLFVLKHSFSNVLRVSVQSSGLLALGSGRARRDAAARAMQGWHAQRSVGYGEITEPIVKVC